MSITSGFPRTYKIEMPGTYAWQILFEGFVIKYLNIFWKIIGEHCMNVR